MLSSVVLTLLLDLHSGMPMKTIVPADDEVPYLNQRDQSGERIARITMDSDFKVFSIQPSMPFLHVLSGLV